MYRLIPNANLPSHSFATKACVASGLTFKPDQVRRIIEEEISYASRRDQLKPCEVSSLEASLPSIASNKWNDFMHHRMRPILISSVIARGFLAVCASVFAQDPVKGLLSLPISFLNTVFRLVNNGSKLRYAIRGEAAALVADLRPNQSEPETWYRPLHKLSKIMANQTMSQLSREYRLSAEESKEVAKAVERERVIRLNEFWRGRPRKQFPLEIATAVLSFAVTGILIAVGAMTAPLLVPIGISLYASIGLSFFELEEKMKAALHGAGFKVIASFQSTANRKLINTNHPAYIIGNRCLDQIIARYQNRFDLCDEASERLRQKLTPSLMQKHDEFLKGRLLYILTRGPITAAATFGGACLVALIAPPAPGILAAAGITAILFSVLSVICAGVVEIFKLKGLLDTRAMEYLADQGLSSSEVIR